MFHLKQKLNPYYELLSHFGAYLMSDERMMPLGRRRRIMKRPGVAFFLWNMPAYLTRMSMSSLPISSLIVGLVGLIAIS